MANKYAKAPNNSHGNEDSVDSLRQEKELDFSGESNYVSISNESKSKRLIRWVNPHQALVLTVKDSVCHGLEYRIPKPMVSLDEKYLRRCLELIHLRARCNVSGIDSFWSENSSPLELRSGDGFEFDSPRLVGESGSVVVGPTGQWILGSITGSKTTTKILKSPLLHQYGNDANGSVRFDFVESWRAMSVPCSPTRLEKGTPIRDRLKYDYDSHGRDKRVSISSTNSVSSSDRTSSSASGAIGQAMLQCTWKSDKSPHFVFSSDEHKEVYVANLWSVESRPRDEKSLDYVYSFHSGKKTGSNDHYHHHRLVGKMKVSNSFTLGENNSKIVETEFVLFGGDEEGCVTEIPASSSHCLRKHRALSRKVADVFRTSKALSKLSENHLLDSASSSSSSLTLLGGNPPTNLELAAVIVRDRVVDDAKNDELGGWGLKFLKKIGVKQSSSSFECTRNSGDCSTSMEILVPAGLHGGPKTRNGGPSRLTERWSSGGRCDCGGWDIGCPLTLLKPKPNEDEAQTQEEFKSFDLITQGSSDNGAPTLRLVNVQDGLYFVHFQRTLSILQSFSIAVAIIHARSPSLRPKDVRELK